MILTFLGGLGFGVLGILGGLLSLGDLQKLLEVSDFFRLS